MTSAGQFDGQGDHHTPKPFVRQAFRKYLECGIFAHGFARARCDDCGHDYFVAFSCKGRGVCPSCNTRRMVETAADGSCFPPPAGAPVGAVGPEAAALLHAARRGNANMVLRIFLRAIAQSLQTHSPGAAQVDKAEQHIGAVAFIHRFGSSLNEHVHFHVCVVDGVFEEVAGDHWTSLQRVFVNGSYRCTTELRFAPLLTYTFESQLRRRLIGSSRHIADLALAVRRLCRTYDTHVLESDQMIGLLPKEFSTFAAKI